MRAAALVLDFETRSRVDLKKAGADRYASDLSTDIICLAVFDRTTGINHLWTPGELPSPKMVDLLLTTDFIEAHNARFDQLIYEYIATEHGFPELDRSVWHCTATQARVNALPADLDGVTRVLNTTHKKDYRGTQLIKKLCIPDKKTGEFNEDPKLMREMYQYCLQDTLATADLGTVMRPTTEEEHRDWQISERINNRGIKIDVELAQMAATYAESEKREIGQRLSYLTDGRVTKATQTARTLTMLIESFGNTPAVMACVTKEDGKHTFDKNARAKLLDTFNLHDSKIPMPEEWKAIIEAVDEGGAGSVSKFNRLLDMADPVDHRVRGSFIYYGARQTGRFSSKGAQLHNMRRDCFSPDETERLKADMLQGNPIQSPVMDSLSKLLRPTLIPEQGHKFVVGDWSAVEAMVLPWLAGDSGEVVLDIFRSGRDIYMETAKGMAMIDRQIGKVAVLSLGFGGAAGAFNAMAKNYGVNLPINQVLSIVKKWRTANPWATKFWKELSMAAMNAVKWPGQVFNAGRIRYICIPDLIGNTLMCILPDDSTIQYPQVRVDAREGLTAMKAAIQPPADSEEEWPRTNLWYGQLAENVTQATAACLLKNLLRTLDKDDRPVVAHAHDEVILEVELAEVDETIRYLQTAMEKPPVWAEGLPLIAEPQIFDRYGK